MAGEGDQRSTKTSVLEQLARTRQDRPGLQVFLHGDVPAKDVQRIAREIVEEATAAGAALLGPVSKLARSFAVHGELSALRRIAQRPEVKTVLPTHVDDVLPKPIEERD